MNVAQIKTTSLTPEQQATTLDDLQFIASLVQKAKVLGYRIIIHGGYAVDGALGSITRPHNDIDIQIYGKDEAQQAVKRIISSFDSSLLSNLEDNGRKEYWHYFHLKRPNTLAELYYLQVTTDPFTKEKIIIKENGTLTDPQSYGTILVTLEGVSYEAQSPAIELADRIYKREYRGDIKKEKHEQDIRNLQLIVDKKDEKQSLEEMKKRG